MHDSSIAANNFRTWSLGDLSGRIGHRVFSLVPAETQSALSHWWFAAIVGTAILLPLMLNGGYYSHDEFQWAALVASSSRPALSELWGNVTAFQYRPLAFSLWMLLSHYLFESPRLFHTAFALIGLVNALLLRAFLLRVGMEARAATLGMVLFLANPYSMYVNAWVATPEDQLWVTCAMLIALSVSRPATTRRGLIAACMAVAALTVAALFSKEAAVVLPALLTVTWLFTRKPHLLWASFAAALPVIAYLALRLNVILDTPAHVVATYGWSLALIPQRWLQYLSFPLAVPIWEVWQLSSASLAAVLALGVATGAMVLALLRTAPRLGSWWLLAGAAAVSPVLILFSASNQYGYGLAAITAGVLAFALPRARGLWRTVLIGAVLLQSVHAGVVAWHMLDSGKVARRFMPEASKAVSRADVFPVRLRLAEGVNPWGFSRLLHNVREVRGVPMEGRVQFVSDLDFAHYEIRRNGSLKALVND